MEKLQDLLQNKESKWFKDTLKKRLVSVLETKETENVLNILNKLSFTNLFALLKFVLISKITWDLSKKDIVRKSDSLFTKPKYVDILKLRNLEDKMLIEFLNNWFQYIEISPLKPLWTSYIVWKNNPAKVIHTTNWFELMNDPTYSLTLELVRKIRNNRNFEKEALITLSTSIRNQKFNNPMYLPYFKTISGSLVLPKKSKLKDLDGEISKIINLNIKFLNSLKQKGEISKITLQLSNGKILYEILKDELELSDVDAKELVYNYRKKYWNWFTSKIFENLGISIDYKFNISNIKNSKYHKYFDNILKYIDSSLLSEVEIDFSRLAWIWHYNWTIFTLFISDNYWNTTDIVDGGSVNWINDLLSTKWYKQIVFGLWIELLSKFIDENK